MAPARLLTGLVLATSLLTACSGSPPPESGVAGEATSAPAPAASATTPDAPVATSDSGTPAEPHVPDLSGATIDCDAVEGPCEPGDDPGLDELWEACAAGDGRACDRLYYDSAFDTRYEQFGNTCGDRDVLVPCPRELRG